MSKIYSNVDFILLPQQLKALLNGEVRVDVLQRLRGVQPKVAGCVGVIPGRRYCTFDEATGRRTFQLHCFEPASREIERHLAFRDYLRANPMKAQEYDEEKQRCRDLHPDDSHAYSDAKAAWIEACLSEALTRFRSLH